MPTGTGIRSVMVEFHRFGEAGAVLERGKRYIRTTGFDEPAREISVGLDHYGFLRNLNKLRYGGGASSEDVDAAVNTLTEESARMLCDLPACEEDETIQFDLVTGAAELWAFPFEVFAPPERRVVLTRRIRGQFGAHASWPAVPRVLFVHGGEGGDLPASLIADHVTALRDALRPWSGGAEPDDKLLVVRELYSLADLVDAASGAFTHIHLLAHGEGIPDPEVPQHVEWGLHLGAETVHPRDVASALAPRHGLPVAITVAACDSGNQADPAIPSYSLAQELHRRGIPVVVASQLPLTMPGSVLLARHFYEPLLRGDDVRNALHEARHRLHDERATTHHDWLSTVAYVRLPENYDEHLSEVGLKAELQMLRAAQRRADQVIKENRREELKAVEQLVDDRIASLEERLRDLAGDAGGLRRHECQGLLASAHKRRAELLFLSGADREAQRQELQSALKEYRVVFRTNVQMHWQGVQQLALEAVLHGRFDPIDYTTVLRGAELAVERSASEYWALGTLAELHLLAELAGRPNARAAAEEAVREFRRRAAGKEDDIDSTRRQFLRYVQWWTKENGFMTDLQDDAAALVALLSGRS